MHQLEYAMEAISKGGTAVGVLTKEGIVFASERRITSPLIDYKTDSEKMHRIDKHIACILAGLHADANTLIEYAYKNSQAHYYRYQEPIPVEQLVQRVCDLKHGYTQFGGYRPFGASFVVGGWDEQFGFQLYESDPSGNYSGWSAVAIGFNSNAATEVLKKDYKEDLSLREALLLALKAICRALDITEPSAEKLEFSVLTRPEGERAAAAPGKPDVKWEVLKGAKLDDLVAEAKLKVEFSAD